MHLDALTPSDELQADLTLEQLQQLVGPGRVRRGRRRLPGDRLGRDRLRRRQRHPDRALLPVRVGHGARRLLRPRDRQPRPQGVRAHARARSGSSINGAVDPDSPLADHHRRHGDGVVDIALEVPDVDRCIAQAREAGATVVARARGRHRRARHRPDRRDRDVRRDPAHARRPLAGTTAPTCPATSPRELLACKREGAAEAAVPGARPHRRQRRARPHGRVGRASTTRSWAS